MLNLLEGDKRIVAVDPGKSGAVAHIGRGDITVMRDFKTLFELGNAVLTQAEDTHMAVIELVGAMPGQGVCSMFSFGKATGVAYGALHASGHEHIIEVAPLRWQNWYRHHLQLDRIDHPDFDSREIALRLLPAKYAPLFKRKKDHNTADAVLIGLWALATTSGDN